MHPPSLTSPHHLVPVVLGMAFGPLIASSPARTADAFVDVTASSGVDFIHTTGAKGQKHLVETMGGGGGWLDYDGDGRLDIYLVNGHSDAREAASPGRESNRLYRNLGDGRFADVTDSAGVGDRGYGFGLAVGDIDADGDQDLFVTNFGPDVLYRNRGDGTFEDITAHAGVAGSAWGASAAFVDIDRDGDLDLYVTNYLVYDPHVDVACRGNPRKLPSYCHPNKYDGPADSLFLNEGDGRFRDISKEAGIAVTGRILAKGLGVLATDYDGDGDQDIFVANDSVPNFLWRNLGGGRFEDAALEAGVSLDSNGKPEACMGIDSVDWNGDGELDYFVTNFSQETDTLYLGEGDGFFEDATVRVGLARPTYTPLGFGTRFVDHDLDGDFDLFVARGHILDNIAELHPGSDLTFAQSDQLFENVGGTFEDVSSRAGPYFASKHVGRAAAFADWDDDGDADILIVNLGEAPTLLRNEAREMTKRHWLGLRLVGNGPSPLDAYGARVTVPTKAGRITQEVRSASSYLSASDPRLIVGLGDGAEPTYSVEVRWPDGLAEVFTGVAPDAYRTLTRGRGKRR